MERRVGSNFYYENNVLIIKEGNGCDGCFFYDEYCCEDKIRNIIGDCTDKIRTDGKPIIFIQNGK